MFKFEDESDNRIIMSLALKGESATNVISLKLNDSIKGNLEKSELLNASEKEMAFIFGRIISISMYMIHFSKDKRRVNESTRKITREPKGVKNDKR